MFKARSMKVKVIKYNMIAKRIKQLNRLKEKEERERLVLKLTSDLSEELILKYFIYIYHCYLRIFVNTYFPIFIMT